MDYFKCKLDDKNRIIIPVEVRREFEKGKVILTPGCKNYLHLYTQETWEDEMRAALSGSWKTEGDRPAILDEDLADLADRLLDGQQATTLDQKRGRITIDSELLERAGFTRIREVAVTRIPTAKGHYWRLKTPTV
jgi:DNA-binding transcriptional regulator/RsmH inhibitor MraZ